MAKGALVGKIFSSLERLFLFQLGSLGWGGRYHLTWEGISLLRGFSNLSWPWEWGGGLLFICYLCYAMSLSLNSLIEENHITYWGGGQGAYRKISLDQG